MNVHNVKIISLNVRSILKATRFKNLYNMMRANSIDVLLLQKANLSEEIAAYYKLMHLKISIIANIALKESTYNPLKAGVAIIINLDMTIWHIGPLKEGHITYKNNGRVLACSVKKNT